MKKKALIGSTLALLFVAFVFIVQKPQTITPPDTHVWSEYKNDKLEFAMMYPSDIVHPREITEPASNDGTFPGAETVVFLDSQEQQKYISVWVQETKAKNTDEWFREVYGPDGRGWHISTTTSVARINAIGVSENTPSVSYETFDLNFVKSRHAWSLFFDDVRLSSQDIEYMRQSFRFLK